MSPISADESEIPRCGSQLLSDKNFSQGTALNENSHFEGLEHIDPDRANGEKRLRAAVSLPCSSSRSNYHLKGQDNSHSMSII